MVKVWLQYCETIVKLRLQRFYYCRTKILWLLLANGHFCKWYHHFLYFYNIYFLVFKTHFEFVACV